jgi:hypothetical protein
MQDSARDGSPLGQLLLDNSDLCDLFLNCILYRSDDSLEGLPACLSLLSTSKSLLSRLPTALWLKNTRQALVRAEEHAARQMALGFPALTDRDDFQSNTVKMQTWMKTESARRKLSEMKIAKLTPFVLRAYYSSTLWKIDPGPEWEFAPLLLGAPSTHGGIANANTTDLIYAEAHAF